MENLVSYYLFKYADMVHAQHPGMRPNTHQRLEILEQARTRRVVPLRLLRTPLQILVINVHLTLRQTNRHHVLELGR